mgnify:CR=1 FL=1
MNNHEVVEGCPAADGKAACCRNCGGGWPGTRVTTMAMTRAVQSGRLDPERLGCQPLQDRARAALQALQPSPES